jgi:hypothetical protein
VTIARVEGFQIFKDRHGRLQCYHRKRGSSSSTQRWNGVPRGTMDEVSPLGRLDLRAATQGRPLDCSTSSSNSTMEAPWCRFRREARVRERHRHCSAG